MDEVLNPITPEMPAAEEPKAEGMEMDAVETNEEAPVAETPAA